MKSTPGAARTKGSIATRSQDKKNEDIWRKERKEDETKNGRLIATPPVRNAATSLKLKARTSHAERLTHLERHIGSTSRIQKQVCSVRRIASVLIITKAINCLNNAVEAQ